MDKYILRVRSYTGEEKVALLLIEQSGMVRQDVLRGELYPDAAEKLVEWFGDMVTVQRETPG